MTGRGEQPWTQFRLLTFGDPYLVWHDGPDFTRLGQQWQTEPDHVQRMVIEGLQQRDPVQHRPAAVADASARRSLG